MKTTVTRELQGGLYFVIFAFTDFTSEELEKMRAFGVPALDVMYMAGTIPGRVTVPINQIDSRFKPGFPTPEQAKAYEQSVIDQARAAMEALRQRKDDFSGTKEVAI